MTPEEISIRAAYLNFCYGHDPHVLALVAAGLEGERDSANARAELARAALAQAESKVVAILQKALAGYDEAYKYTDESGRSFTRWGEVMNDIRSALTILPGEDGER